MSNAPPIAYEARLAVNDERLRADQPLRRRDGREVWSVMVPANGRAALTYTVTDLE